VYELNKDQLNNISGGYTVYVTEEWKEQEAAFSGYFYGAFGAFLGGLFAGAASPSSLAVIGGALVGGIVGYPVGYGLSLLQNYPLENNTWYDFEYIIVYY